MSPIIKGSNKRLWAAVLLVMVIVGYAAWLPPTETWADEAAGHNGQVLFVNRTVEFLFGGGELHSMLTRYPSRYSLEFTNPSDGRRIRWHGEKYVLPVLLDIVGGTPWLVVFSNAIYSNSDLYGCPEVPYAFLMFDSAKSRWLPKPASEAPIVLTTANLSYRWWKHFMEHKPLQTAADIQGHYFNAKSESGGAFNPQIPRTYSEWNYKYKKQAASSRRPNDC